MRFGTFPTQAVAYRGACPAVKRSGPRHAAEVARDVGRAFSAGSRAAGAAAGGFGGSPPIGGSGGTPPRREREEGRTFARMGAAGCGFLWSRPRRALRAAAEQKAGGAIRSRRLGFGATVTVPRPREGTPAGREGTRAAVTAPWYRNPRVAAPSFVAIEFAPPPAPSPDRSSSLHYRLSSLVAAPRRALECASSPGRYAAGPPASPPPSLAGFAGFAEPAKRAQQAGAGGREKSDTGQGNNGPTTPRARRAGEPEEPANGVSLPRRQGRGELRLSRGVRRSALLMLSMMEPPQGGNGAALPEASR